MTIKQRRHVWYVSLHWGYFIGILVHMPYMEHRGNAGFIFINPPFNDKAVATTTFTEGNQLVANQKQALRTNAL